MKTIKNIITVIVVLSACLTLTAATNASKVPELAVVMPETRDDFLVSNMLIVRPLVDNLPLTISFESRDDLPLYWFYSINNRNNVPVYYRAEFYISNGDYSRTVVVDPCNETKSVLSDFGLFYQPLFVPANSEVGIVLVFPSDSPPDVNVSFEITRLSYCSRLEIYEISDNLKLESSQDGKWLKMQVTVGTIRNKALAQIQVAFFRDGKLTWTHNVGVGQIGMLESGETQRVSVDLTRYTHDEYQITLIPLEKP